MINGKDIYDVLAALVPLYVAMILAYASVRWWKIFSPEQCAGINRFVAVFAVPLLSFHFISSNNPYAMNFRFIAADSLQKVAILLALFLWKSFYKHGSLEWMITFFSLSTLPNTLVMGIPLLESMYGQFSGELMVQIVVLQSVIWYTLMLIMFEYRGAKLLISEQFPETAGKIASVRVDSDVVSLNGLEILQADAEIGGDGKLHVVVQRSPAPSSRGLDSMYSMNSRAGLELSGVEIYSVPSSLAPTPRASSLKHGYGAGGDVFSPGSPNFEEETMKVGRKTRRGDWRSMSSSELFNNGGAVHPYPHPNPVFLQSSSVGGGGMPEKDLHMFVWSSNASSPVSEGNMRLAVNRADYGVVDQETAASGGMHDLSENIISHARKLSGERDVEIEDGAKSHFTLAEEKGGNNIRGKKVEMPAASVMTKLILIMVWRKLIRNPNTYASLLGLAWALISFRWHIKMPKIVSGSISILSDAGLGMAMFSLGLFMALQPRIIACGKSLALFAMAIRFLIGPAVIAATSAAIGIRGDLFRIAIVQAALPQGIVPFVFAKEYNVHADILSTAVIFGMLVALPITILYYVLLGL